MTFLLKNHPKIFCLPRELNFDRLPGTHIAKRLDHSDHPDEKIEPEGSFHSTLSSLHFTPGLDKLPCRIFQFFSLVEKTSEA